MKVSLACLYDVGGACTARIGNASGKQRCVANAATGEDKIEYACNMNGWTANVAGTTHLGYVDINKTDEHADGQYLVCEYQLGGEAQFFKVFQAPSKILSCDLNGPEVSCYCRGYRVGVRVLLHPNGSDLIWPSCLSGR
jgi:hypothetical protein